MKFTGINSNGIENEIKLLNMEVAKLESELKHKQNRIKMLEDIKPMIKQKEKRGRQIERERDRQINELNAKGENA